MNLHFFFHRKEKLVLRPIIKIAFFVILIAIVIVPIKLWAKKAGDFLKLSPSLQHADCLLVEAFVFPTESLIKEACMIFQAQSGKKLYVLIDKISHGMLGVDSAEIAAQTRKFATAQGLSKECVEVLLADWKNPVTLNKAKFFVNYLPGKKKVKSVLLLTDSFHMRRSYLAYKKVLNAHDIEVYPCPITRYISTDNWWKSVTGIKLFYAEYLKLIYYYVHGYI